MTKVTISETYAVGCTACEEQLQRLCRWSCRDSQVSGLTLKQVPRCEHALPALAGKAASKLPPVAEMKRVEPPSMTADPRQQQLPGVDGGDPLGGYSK